MAIENLKMHIGLTFFIFNIAFWLYVVNQNKKLVWSKLGFRFDVSNYNHHQYFSLA
jgi:hypothetical protein